MKLSIKYLKFQNTEKQKRQLRTQEEKGSWKRHFRGSGKRYFKESVYDLRVTADDLTQQTLY